MRASPGVFIHGTIPPVVSVDMLSGFDRNEVGKAEETEMNSLVQRIQLIHISTL
jgi:hypothetical protein